jgi:hypothetical protein
MDLLTRSNGTVGGRSFTPLHNRTKYGIIPTVKFDDYTKEERIELMRKDIRAYLDLCTIDHMIAILEGIAKSGPVREEDKTAKTGDQP